MRIIQSKIATVNPDIIFVEKDAYLELWESLVSDMTVLESRLSEKEWGSEMNKDLPMHSFSLLFAKI